MRSRGLGPSLASGPEYRRPGAAARRVAARLRPGAAPGSISLGGAACLIASAASRLLPWPGGPMMKATIAVPSRARRVASSSAISSALRPTNGSSIGSWARTSIGARCPPADALQASVRPFEATARSGRGMASGSDEDLARLRVLLEPGGGVNACPTAIRCRSSIASRSTSASPVSTPMRTASAPAPPASSAHARAHRSAARSARTASSAWAVRAPKMAQMASPCTSRRPRPPRRRWSSADRRRRQGGPSLLWRKARRRLRRPNDIDEEAGDEAPFSVTVHGAMHCRRSACGFLAVER